MRVPDRGLPRGFTPEAHNLCAKKKGHVLPHAFPVHVDLWLREFASAKFNPGFAGEMRWENRGTMRQLGNS